MHVKNTGHIPDVLSNSQSGGTYKCECMIAQAHLCMNTWLTLAGLIKLMESREDLLAAVVSHTPHLAEGT